MYEDIEELGNLSDKDSDDSKAPIQDFWTDSESLRYTVIRPHTNATCEDISCVTHSGRRDTVCLDMRMVNMSAGALSGKAGYFETFVLFSKVPIKYFLLIIKFKNKLWRFRTNNSLL